MLFLLHVNHLGTENFHFSPLERPRMNIWFKYSRLGLNDGGDNDFVLLSNSGVFVFCIYICPSKLLALILPVYPGIFQPWSWRERAKELKFLHGIRWTDHVPCWATVSKSFLFKTFFRSRKCGAPSSIGIQKLLFWSCLFPDSLYIQLPAASF
jgi:hypothetical protein